MAQATPLPMFPLGNVLFPYGVLPLRVFEPRYLEMISVCSAGDGEFGVVLIERGGEVGGGDVRSSLGTRAKILQVADLPDGHQAVVAIGVGRIRVDEWLPDDPYPVALVTDLDDPPCRPIGDRIEATERRLRRVLALHSELGLDVGDLSYRLDDDPITASYQVCALAPIGAFDAQKLLARDDARSRLDLLGELLGEQATLLEQRLGGA